jgi:hypothetical protein
MNDHDFDNKVVCPAIYTWVKGDGPEPYSPAVASLTVLVLDLLKMDRQRQEALRAELGKGPVGT